MMMNDENDDLYKEGEPIIPASSGSSNTEQVRERERKNVRAKFISNFPTFDIVNLDLCGFLFRPTRLRSGKILASIRKLFRFQR